MAIEGELGCVGEIRAELQEERPEVAIDTIEVVMIDHRCCPDNPGVRSTGLRALPPLAPKDSGLLLRLADEEHALVGPEISHVLRGDVVLALPPLEGHQRH